jgi:hypothetical protein
MQRCDEKGLDYARARHLGHRCRRTLILAAVAGLLAAAFVGGPALFVVLYFIGRVVTSTFGISLVTPRYLGVATERGYSELRWSPSQSESMPLAVAVR